MTPTTFDQFDAVRAEHAADLWPVDEVLLAENARRRRRGWPVRVLGWVSIVALGAGVVSIGRSPACREAMLSWATMGTVKPSAIAGNLSMASPETESTPVTVVAPTPLLPEPTPPPQPALLATAPTQAAPTGAVTKAAPAVPAATPHAIPRPPVRTTRPAADPESPYEQLPDRPAQQPGVYEPADL